MKLSDFFKRKKETLPVVQSAEIPKINKKTLLGDFARLERTANFFGGLSDVFPNPDSILKARGNSYQVYRDLLMDPHLSGLVLSRKSAVMASEWTIDANGNKAAADLIFDIFNNIDLSPVFSNILDAVLFGFQPIEIIWDYNGKYFVPQKLLAKPLDWFAFDIHSNLLFLSEDNQDGEPVPDYKFLCPKYEASYSNPYGNPLLARCFWNVLFKKNGKKFWVTFTEKYGMPWVVAKYLASTNEEQVANLMEALINTVQNGVVIHPDNVSVDLKTTGQTINVEIFERLIEDCRTENAITVLGHTGSSQSTPGKLGNENSAIEVMDNIVEADMKLIESTMNKLIQMICALNFNSTDIPVFRFFNEEQIDKDRAERDAILALSLGIVFNEDYVSDKYNIDKKYFKVSAAGNNINNSVPSTLLKQDSSANSSVSLELQQQLKGLKDIYPNLTNDDIKSIYRSYKNG